MLLILLSTLNTESFILLEYKDYTDIFSKVELDILLLYRLHDYKIIFKDDNKKVFKYSFFYKMFFEKFEIIKKYIIDNLQKGFIEFN